MKQTAIDLPAIQNIPQENSYNPRLGNIKVKSVIKNIIDYIYLLITNGKTLTHIYIDIFCSYTMSEINYVTEDRNQNVYKWLRFVS